MAKEKKERSGVVSGIFVGYAILVLHGALALLFGLAIVFFRGVVEYLPWIVAGGLSLIAFSAYLIWRRIRRSHRGLRDVLDNPVLRDRPLEISFLGGLASLRLGQGAQMRGVDTLSGEIYPQLETPETHRVRQLESLATLRRDGVISEQEFLRLKRDVMQEQRGRGEEVEIIH